jgi:hypothetical protein
MRSSFRDRTANRRAASGERHAGVAVSSCPLPAARRSAGQRGYVLISAIALAILYFGLMQLMLIDSSHALHEAQRFRARIVASTLAENAAELAAANMINNPAATTTAQDDQGKMIGGITVNGSDFEIVGQGDATGTVPQSATVRVQGRIVGNHIAIDYTFHSQ